ncbi:hypothetical protein ACLOJK_027351, partial [Asimina triloba]
MASSRISQGNSGTGGALGFFAGALGLAMALLLGGIEKWINPELDLQHSGEN